jgi:hypothetical protein
MDSFCCRAEQASCYEKGHCTCTNKNFLFPNCPQWLRLWMYSQHSKFLCNRYNVAWSFWGLFSIGHTMMTGATRVSQ